MTESIKIFKKSSNHQKNKLWQKSEILRIFNCSELSVSLRKNQDGIADKMNGKILLFENIAELRMNEFLVGVPTNNENIGTVITSLIVYTIFIRTMLIYFFSVFKHLLQKCCIQNDTIQN